MNKIILNELDKLGLTWSEHIYIPKKSGVKLKEDSCYLIKLDDYLLNMKSNDSLVVNWNSGIKPTCKYYKADINKIMSNMIKITGIGYDMEKNLDLNSTFFGWLPIEKVEVIKKL